MTVAALVGDLRARGVTLVPEGDKLRVRPVSAISADELASLRRYKTEVIAVLSRAEVFRRQIVEWAAAGRVATPILVLADTPPVRLGRCVSCGEPLPPDQEWRCVTCIEAVRLALDTGGGR